LPIHTDDSVQEEQQQLTLRHRLSRSMMLLVLGTVALLTASGLFLMLSPSLESVAHARIAQLAITVETRVQRLAVDTERQLRIAGQWLSGGTLPLDHQALNRRFMPILAQNPQYSSMLIADPAGNEWMLSRKPEGGWLNRLTTPREGEEAHRFLEWRDNNTLEREEQRPSEYDAKLRPWFLGAMAMPVDRTAWTGIYQFFTSKKPGVTASMRINGPDGNGELIVGLDLLLDDIARHLSKVRMGRKGLAVVLSREGRLLGVSGQSGARTSPETLIYRPVIEIDLGPLQQGLGLWREGGSRPGQDRLIWHDWELWHIGYRRLDLGKERVWLGVHLPLSELIPGIYLQLLALAAVVVIAVGGVLSLVLATARGFSRPLEQLAENSLRIGDLDFSTPEPVESEIQEVTQLAQAQDQMRRMLASAHEELVTKHRELQAAQARLIQAAKLESVGRLAAGVAHEVKNPLAVMQMGVEFLQREIENPESKEVLADMDNAVHRADGVIKGLLDFSREKRLDLQNGDLNEILRSSLQMVRHELKKRGIRVEQHLNNELPAIPLDVDKLRQVFINLAINAAHAMDKDGILTVTTDLRRLTDGSGLERDHAHRFNSGDTALWVELADTGPGLSDEQQQRIFDPFFTTKEVGEGTGLGLSVSRNIVELHHGSIDIRNRPEGGASAVLLFKLI